MSHWTSTGLASMQIGALAATQSDCAQAQVVAEGVHGLSAQVNDTLDMGPTVITASTQI